MSLHRVRARLLRREEGGRYVHLVFALEDTTWQILPGQFVQVQVREPGQYDPFLYRPFSAFWAEPGKLGLLVLPRGRGTRWLVIREQGTELALLGSLGQPWPRFPAWVWWAAGAASRRWSTTCGNTRMPWPGCAWGFGTTFPPFFRTSFLRRCRWNSGVNAGPLGLAKAV
jgi:2-polyprenylphenol hydroxylase and related flavodoxin oxidoreductases